MLDFFTKIITRGDIMEEKTVCELDEISQVSTKSSCANNESEEMLYGLYGSWIDKKHCVGYCKFHKGYMTFKQIKKKECLQKQCKELERLPHQFWEQRAIKKQKKKIRKECE